MAEYGWQQGKKRNPEAGLPQGFRRYRRFFVPLRNEINLYCRVVTAITPPIFPVPNLVVASHER